MDKSQFELIKMIPFLKNNNKEEVIRFANTHGFDKVHVVTSDFVNDHTLLTFAIIFSSPEMLSTLLKNGASPNVYSNMGYTTHKTAEEGGPIKMYTPLHYCVIQNKLEHAKVLLDNGADVTLPNPQGKTAFNIATSSKMRELIQSYESP